MKKREYKRFENSSSIRRVISNSKPFRCIDKYTGAYCIVFHHLGLSAYGKDKEDAEDMLMLTLQYEQQKLN